jgi:HK97 family phage major capsid protein
MDETTDSTETTETQQEDKRLAPIASLMGAVLEKREANFLAGLEREIALLGVTPEDKPEVKAAQRAASGENERIISRHQPTDPLYRNLHRTQPAYREVRTPDLDHWNTQWLRGFLARDMATMKMATAKANEAAGYRATTLEGVLDVSDPTAIVDGTGGHLLPQPFADVVEIARGAASVVAPLCTNFTTTGATLRVPTAGAVTADTVAEGASGAQGEPTFTSEMLILHKIGVRMIASDEMLDDSAFNLMDLYGRRAGEGIGVAEDTQILTTGGTSPDLTEALAGGVVTSATTTVMIYEDLNTLFFALGKAYQPNATWLAGTLVMTLLSNMMDGNDHPILKIPSNAPTPVTDATPQAIGTVLGRPIYHVPATAGVLILGDLRGYAVVRKGGIVAKMSTDVGFATDTVQFKFTERIDGRIIDDAAIKQTDEIATVA